MTKAGTVATKGSRRGWPPLWAMMSAPLQPHQCSTDVRHAPQQRVNPPATRPHSCSRHLAFLSACSHSNSRSEDNNAQCQIHSPSLTRKRCGLRCRSLQARSNYMVQIRNKRLAKLGGQQATSPTPAPASVTADISGNNVQAQDVTATQPSASQPAPSPKASSTSSPNPFAQLGLKKEPEDSAPKRSQINITPLKRDSDAIPRPRSRQGRQETPEDWEDRTLSAIFRVTLKEDRPTDAQGNRLQYLPGLKSDLEDGAGDAPLRLSVGTLDSAILEAATNLQNTKPLEYLLGCWKRVIRLGRSTRSATTEAWKLDIVKEARRLCMSYCLFAVNEPEMFGMDASGPGLLAEHMIVDPECDRGTCFEFFQEAAARVPEDDSARDALVEAMVECSRRLSHISMDGDYRPYMMVRVVLDRSEPQLTVAGPA